MRAGQEAWSLSRVHRSLSEALMGGASLQTLPKAACPPGGHHISCTPVSIQVFAPRVGRPHYWAPRKRRLSVPRGRGHGSPWGFCCLVVGTLHQQQTGSAPCPTWDILSQPHLSPEVSRTLTVRGGHGSLRTYITVFSPPYRVSRSNFTITSRIVSYPSPPCLKMVGTSWTPRRPWFSP